MTRDTLVSTMFMILLCWSLPQPADGRECKPIGPLRAGIIGLDTSHVVTFTKMLNGPDDEGTLADVRIVAAYAAGSPDLLMSRDRVEGFTKTLRDTYHVEIVDSVEALLDRVDVVLLESVDGRTHLAQVEPVLKAGKPVFIDKPVSTSLADAIRIYEIAEKYGTPCFSASTLRFRPGIARIASDPKLGPILGCNAYSPCSRVEGHPELAWYGVHGIEMLFTVMGTGCSTVTHVHTEGAEVLVGTWEGGRVGTYRAVIEGRAGYGVTVFGTKGIGEGSGAGSYEEYLGAICEFFRSRRSPVSPGTTLEIFAFMEAADESERRGGTPVSIAETMALARERVAGRGPAETDGAGR